MIPLTQQVHALLESVLIDGETVIDATAGNGHDTLFLARTVGPKGHVYAFDRQQQALENTRERLESNGFNNFTLLKHSHAKMENHIPKQHHGKVGAITFNLGYLPGSDKTIRTESQSTLQAIQSGLQVLRPQGILTLIAYTGHPGGADEANEVCDFLNRSALDQFKVQEFATNPELSSPPRLFVVKKES